MNFMYVHLWATQSMLQPSSWPREPYTKIHKHGLNHGVMTY